MGRFSMQNSGARAPSNTGYVGTKTTTQKTFDCIFCESEKSVSVTLIKKEKIGKLRCQKCRKTFETKIIPHLHADVDVYATWMDTCKEVATKELAKTEEKPKVESKKSAEPKKLTTKPTKPVSKKRRHDTDSDVPEPDTKRSKLNATTIEYRPANPLKPTSTRPDSVKPHHSSLVDLTKQAKRIRRSVNETRERKIAVVQSEASRAAALAKARREKKAVEWARLEREETRKRRALAAAVIARATEWSETRKWKEVTAATVAAAAVMKVNRILEEIANKKAAIEASDDNTNVADATVATTISTESRERSHDALSDSPSDGDMVTKPPKKKKSIRAVAGEVPMPQTNTKSNSPGSLPTPPTTPPFLATQPDDLYDAIFIESSFRYSRSSRSPSKHSTNSISDVPTPQGNPKSSRSSIEEQLRTSIPTITIDYVATDTENRKRSRNSLDETTDDVLDGDGEEAGEMRERKRSRTESLNSLFGAIREIMIGHRGLLTRKFGG